MKMIKKFKKIRTFSLFLKIHKTLLKKLIKLKKVKKQEI